MGLGRMGVAQTRIARYYGTKVVAGIDCDAEAREFFESEFEVKAYAMSFGLPFPIERLPPVLKRSLPMHRTRWSFIRAERRHIPYSVNAARCAVRFIRL